MASRGTSWSPPHLPLKQNPACREMAVSPSALCCRLCCRWCVFARVKHAGRKCLRAARQFIQATLCRATRLFPAICRHIVIFNFPSRASRKKHSVTHKHACIRWAKAQTRSTWPLGPVTHSQVLTFDGLVDTLEGRRGRGGVVHSCVHVVHVSRGGKNAGDFPHIYLKVHFDNAVLVWYTWQIQPLSACICFLSSSGAVLRFHHKLLTGSQHAITESIF